jgi:hypothetical protein
LLGVFFEQGIVYSANDSRAANSVKRILGIRLGAQFSAENKDTHNILGVAPAIQKFRVRANLATAQIPLFFQGMIHISKLFKSLTFQVKWLSRYASCGLVTILAIFVSMAVSYILPLAKSILKTL